MTTGRAMTATRLSPLDFQQLPVAQGDVLSRQCGSEQRSRYLPSRFVSVLIFALSMRSSPPGLVRRNRSNPGFPEIVQSILPRSAAVSVSMPTMISFELAADDLVTFGPGGVEAEHEPVIGADRHNAAPLAYPP